MLELSLFHIHTFFHSLSLSLSRDITIHVTSYLVNAQCLNPDISCIPFTIVHVKGFSKLGSIMSELYNYDYDATVAR